MSNLSRHNRLVCGPCRSFISLGGAHHFCRLLLEFCDAFVFMTESAGIYAKPNFLHKERLSYSIPSSKFFQSFSETDIIITPLRCPLLNFTTALTELGGGVALVGSNHCAGLDLLVGVGRVNDQTRSVVDNSECGEAVAGAELARPAGGDGVCAACDWATVGLRGWGSLNDLSARGGGRSIVDAEGPGGSRVSGVDDTLQAGDGPCCGLGHHGDGLSPGLERSGQGASGEEGGEEEGGELHFDYGIIITISV